MALYTVSITDGTTLANLAVSAGRGPKGDGFTGGSYSSSTGQITFTSNDGIGFSTSDIRPEITAAVAAAEAAQAGAETAEAGAEAAQAATESIFDQFGDQYLGPKASDPTVDNDGDPLTEGDIYFNTTDSVLKFYSGTAWVAPESIATTAASDAQAAQAASEAAQAAAETAETNAETAETNAETAETNAAASAAAASSSASAASTSASEAAASAASINLSSIDIDGGTIDGTVIGGSTPAAGSFTTGSFTGNVTFGDNDKAIFGSGSDLLLYYDGSNSYVDAANDGNLYLQSQGTDRDVKIRSDDGSGGLVDYITADGSVGQVKLRYYGDNRLATTASGIDITGIADASTLFRFGVDNSEIANNYLRFKPSGDAFIDHSTVGQDINFRVSNASSLDTTPLVVSSTGIDVTGEITADGLTVESTGQAAALFKGYSSVTAVNSANNGEVILGNNTAYQGKISYEGQTSGALYIENSYNNDAADIVFRSKSAGTAQNKLKLDGNGNISFYDSAGSSQSFFWDAAAESLGIGTTSPAYKLDFGTVSNGTTLFNVTNGSNSNLRFKVEDGVSTIMNTGGSGALAFTSGGSTERLRITSSGDLEMTGGGSVGWANWTITESGGSLYFATGGTNKMKLDASGNLDVVGSVNANATIT